MDSSKPAIHGAGYPLPGGYDDIFINADQTRCFMNYGDRPELVFRQQAGQREIYHSEFFELLQQEALQ